MAFQLAIDGPAASGKSTISRILANKLNWIHIDTGALYRAIAYVAIKNNTNLEDPSQFDFIKKLKIDYQMNKIAIDNEDITYKIRTHKVSKVASQIASYNEVRMQLLDLQKELAASGNIIMDGRDIGTVILPNANLKIYLNADLHERAKRRFKEDSSKTLADIEAEINQRDTNDKTRKNAPLAIASDAIEIDTTNLTIDDVVLKIIELIKRRNI